MKSKESSTAKGNLASTGAASPTKESSQPHSSNRLEWIAIMISVLAIFMSGAQYLLQREGRLSGDQSALLSSQIALGSENATEMTNAYPHFQQAMKAYLQGNVDPLIEVKLRQSALVNRNFQIMPARGAVRPTATSLRWAQ